MKKYAWTHAATKILRSEMAKRAMKIPDLVAALNGIGCDESPEKVQNKLYRGTYSAIFFLQCLKAMNVTHLALTDEFFAPLGGINEKNIETL